MKKIMRKLSAFIAVSCVFSSISAIAAEKIAELGPRPAYLIGQMSDGDLKDKLAACQGKMAAKKSSFSIGHRGAPLQFPEHTKESYEAAATMGAGIVECDVTFTKDKELVCRHSQCDLHTTTDILLRPELAAKCTVPFTPASADGKIKAQAKCCTSDITLQEFLSLKGKMDGANKNATTVEEYVAGTAPYRTDLYSANGTLMTHKDSIELLKKLDVNYTPELKAPAVKMPFDGFSQDDYRAKMIKEYQDAGISADKVFAQSFNLDDVKYWIKNNPDFGKQAVYLDDRYETLEGFDPNKPETFKPSMEELVAADVKIIAPPLWMLVKNDNGKIAASNYAKAAKEAGLDIIAWSLERSGPLDNGGGWYFQSIKDITDNDGVTYELLDVLAQDVGVIGVFSDWPATTTYYANCMGLK